MPRSRGQEATAEAPQARARHQEARRRELVQATIRAVARHGPGVSMEGIAGEAGVTKPILYRHFGDQRGLVGAVADHYLNTLRDEIGSIEEPRLRELMVRRLDAGLRLLERLPGLYEFLTLQRGFAGAGARTGGAQVPLQSLAELVRSELVVRDLDGELAEPWAHAIGGVIHAVVLWWLQHPEVSRERAVQIIVDFVWDGLDPRLEEPA